MALDVVADSTAEDAAELASLRTAWASSASTAAAQRATVPKSFMVKYVPKTEKGCDPIYQGRSGY